MSKLLLTVALMALTSSIVIANEVYTALDADKSGTISQAEADALPSLSEKWKDLDADANGELSTEEFAKFETMEIQAPEMKTPEISSPEIQAPKVN